MTRAERVSYWRDVVGRQRESGQSGAVFCRKEGIKLAQFYRWCRRFRDGDSGKGSVGFVELVAGARQGQSGIRLRVDDRVCIELERGFDPVTLGAVLEVVGTRGGRACLP